MVMPLLYWVSRPLTSPQRTWAVTRLHLLLAKVEPKAIPVPSTCAYADCTSKRVQWHQPVKKALRDTVHQQVEVHPYRCLKCGRTFRVYPPGVTHAQSSERVKGCFPLTFSLAITYSIRK